MPEVIRCPGCGKDTGLWEGVEVPGWRGLNTDGTPSHVSIDREADWHNATPDGTVGCGECDWEGVRGEITIRVGVDGAPLPEVSPHQLTVTAALSDKQVRDD